MAVKDAMIWAVRQPKLTVMPMRQLTLLLLVMGARTEDDRTVRGLAEVLDIPKPSVTRAAQGLADLGYLVHEADPRSLRSILLRVTPEGVAVGRRFLTLAKGP